VEIEITESSSSKVDTVAIAGITVIIEGTLIIDIPIQEQINGIEIWLLLVVTEVEIAAIVELEATIAVYDHSMADGSAVEVEMIYT